MRRAFFVSLCALALTACVQPETATEPGVTRQIPVDGSFTDGRQSWGGKPSYIYKWAVRNNNGKKEVCGVGSFVDLQRRDASRDAMAVRRITNPEGKTILTDLRFFARVNRPSQLDKAKANCKATNEPASRSGRYSLVGRLQNSRRF